MRIAPPDTVKLIRSKESSERSETAEPFGGALRKERTGAPGEIRTPNPQIRSLVLYPVELRAHVPLSAVRGGGGT
jgi:hypothetical protein